jgi:hypothetical protein
VLPDIYPASMNIRYLEGLDKKVNRIKNWKPTSISDSFLYPYYESLVSVENYTGPQYPNRCSHLTSHLTILTNGNVIPCCGAYPPDNLTFESAGLVWGNLLELKPDESIRSIWNNSLFQAGRALVLRNQKVGGKNIPCYNCLDFIS